MVPAAGALQFTTDSIELSAAFGEQKLTAHYPFINSGKEAVTVLDIRSGCGCTVPELKQATYAPGEGGVIDVGYTVGHRQGRQRQLIAVQTDQGEHVLRLTVDIPVRLKMVPRLLLFRPGADEVQVVELDYAEDLPVKIEAVETNNPDFTVLLSEVEEGTRYRLQVRYNSTKPTEARALVRIRSKGESGKEYVDHLHLRRQGSLPAQ